MFSKIKGKVFKTIGFKITLWYSLSVLAILIMAGFLLYYSMQQKLNKEANRLLLDESEDILLQFSGTNFRLKDLKKEIRIETTSGKFHRMSARLLDIEQNVHIVTKNFFDPSFKISKQAVANAKKGKNTIETVRLDHLESPYRLLTKPIFTDGSLEYLFQVAICLDPVYMASNNFKENILILIPGVIAITVIGGFFIARRSLAPVGYVTRCAKSITASKLDTRLHTDHSAEELQELTNTINNMLKRLENSFEKIVRFTSDISHELRTPIANLVAETEVLLAKERTADAYRELHENNLDEYEKLTRMIEDLMVLLRSDSGSENLNVERFSLGKMLKDLGNTFGLIAESKNVNFLINNIKDVHITGDKLLLHRVFSNLLDNAIKYTLTGGDVYVTLEERDNRVIVLVKDTGIGISEDHKEKIFDRFFRSDSSRSRETGGSGLGLSICKNIVALHNGEIEVRSTLKTGSTFAVTLPKSHVNS